MKPLDTIVGLYAAGCAEPLYFFHTLERYMLIRIPGPADVEFRDVLRTMNIEAARLREGLAGMVDGEVLIGASLATATEFAAAMREAARAEPGTPLAAFDCLLKGSYVALLGTEVEIVSHLPKGRVEACLYNNGVPEQSRLHFEWKEGHGSIVDFGLGECRDFSSSESAGTYFVAGCLPRSGRRRLFLAGTDHRGRYISTERGLGAITDERLIVPIVLRVPGDVSSP